MKESKPSARNKVVRGAKRAQYDEVTRNDILDAGYLCHISYLYEGNPVIIPMAYVREKNCVYVHAARKSRLLNSILEQEQACVAVTHLDGLVLARSAFNHSVNYRSAVIFGKPFAVNEDEEKLATLKKITNKIVPGRWEEVRQPSEKEMKATLVVGIRIDEWSCKVRTGAPVDDKPDYDLPIWAGVVPMKTIFEEAQPDPQNKPGLAEPASVTNITNSLK